MRLLRTLVIAGAAACSLSACATATTMLYSNDRLADITAPVFGVTADDITISNRQSTAMGSYYDVTPHAGRQAGQTVRCFYDGNVLGGGIFANAPRCGDQMGTNPLTGS